MVTDIIEINDPILKLMHLCGADEKSGLWLQQEFDKEKIIWEAGRFIGENLYVGTGDTPIQALNDLLKKLDAITGK